MARSWGRCTKSSTPWRDGETPVATEVQITAEYVGELGLGKLELPDHAFIAASRLDGVQIDALFVLDERDLEQLAISHLAHNRWDRSKAGAARSTHSPFAGN